jgi:hypothetical protein
MFCLPRETLEVLQECWKYVSLFIAIGYTNYGRIPQLDALHMEFTHTKKRKGTFKGTRTDAKTIQASADQDNSPAREPQMPWL